WGKNPELMYDRVLRYQDRVRNLYFTFLFVLRAVTKVSISSCSFVLNIWVFYVGLS
ncbi:hypothetical protein CISIN_1g0125551mg, partial [Citrus sinensis]